MTSASDAYSSYTFTLDVLGQVTSIDNQGSGSLPRVVLTQAFDLAGRRTELSATIDGTPDFSTAFTFDGIGRITRVEQTAQAGGNSVADKRVDFQYDAMSRQTVIERYADLGGQNLVARTDLVYDGAGRLTDLTHAKDGQVFTDYFWSYDKLHRVTSARWVRGVDLTYMEDEVANYAYDPTGQLLTADYVYDQLPDESFSFDANGNRTMAGYVTGANNRLTSDGTYNYEYDAEGNRTKRTEIATGEVVEYSWDHRNRLVQVVKKDAQGAVIETVDIEYDLFDRKIEKTVTPQVGPASLLQYVYDGDHLALRFENGNLAARYLYGPAVDQILAEERVDVATGQTSNLYWPLTDNQGSVRDIAEYDAATDETQIVESIDYSAFGKPLPAAQGQQGGGGGYGGGGSGGGGQGGGSSSTVDFVFGYTAREEDDDVGLMWYRARWYDPETGRFASEDPIGFSAGDTNLNRYVFNSPTNFTDPSGLAPPSAQGIHDHHLFVQEFKKIFKNDFPELDIDEFAVMIHKRMVHYSLKEDPELKRRLREKGLSPSKGGFWNSAWKDFLESDAYKKSKNKKKMLLEKMLHLSEKSGIDLCDLSRYGRAKNAKNNARALKRFLELAEENGVNFTKYKKQLKSMIKQLASTEVGRDAIREAAGPLRKILRKGKGALGKVKVPWLAVALFLWTASQEGGDAAAADLIGIDRNIVRNFMRTGGIDIMLNPWLLYPSLTEARGVTVGNTSSFSVRRNGQEVVVGKARIVGIYQKPDGTLIFMCEGRDGSRMPALVPWWANHLKLPIYFPFIDPTDELEKLKGRKK